jgi:integrase
MARKRNPIPSYLFHKATGRARAVWTDLAGHPHQQLLPGLYDSAESRQAFNQLLGEIEASPMRSTESGREVVTINQLMLAFLDHAEQHYRRADGSLTHEVHEYKLMSRYIREDYGHTPAARFGPSALKAIRQKFINAGWCRSLINQRIGRVRRVFKWGTAEELVPVAVYQSLSTVSGLQRGRSKVRESKPVESVEDTIVDATVQHLNRHVAGMVRFQQFTGCRPGEVCAIRRRDIDMSSPIWLYSPEQHKTAWRGKRRVVAIGPQAQKLFRQFFTADLDDYLFCPRRTVEELHANRAAKRRAPRYPSEQRRKSSRKSKRELTPTESYDVNAYGRAIDRACDRAFPAPGILAQLPGETREAWKTRLTVQQKADLKAWQRNHHWNTNQLRHSYATKVRKEHGLEAAQVALGHSRADVTQIYAERNEALAITIASKLG